MRYRGLPDLPPEGAEVYKRLKIHSYEHDSPTREGGKRTSYCLKVWRGKQSRPFEHYAFRSAEHREEHIEKTKLDEDASLAFKEERGSTAKADKEKLRRSVVVGTILHTSWGYDQTNVDFFEVVKRQGAYAWLRKIGADIVGTDRIRACPGEFIGPAFRKLIGAYGCKISECETAWPGASDATHYCTIHSPGH